MVHGFVVFIYSQAPSSDYDSFLTWNAKGEETQKAFDKNIGLTDVFCDNVRISGKMHGMNISNMLMLYHIPGTVRLFMPKMALICSSL